MFKLKPHQQRALNEAIQHEQFLVFLPTGAGKTVIAARWAQFQWDEGDSILLVITATAKLMGDVAKEFKEQSGLAVKTEIIDAKTKHLEYEPNTLYVVNYESLHKIPFLDQLNIWILDEIHNVKAPMGKRNKILHRARRSGQRVLGITATSIANNLLDMFGMMKVIDDNALGRYKTHFETEYGKPHPKIRYVTLYPKRSYKRVVDYLTGRWIYGDPIEVNKDETGQVIYEVYEQYLEFDLSKDDRERYDVLNLAHMYDDTFIELPLTKNMKLLQMVCSDLKYNTRLQTLANWINTNIGNLDKFAVYTKYIASREQLAMLLDKLGMTYAIQDGRHKDIKKFKEPTTQVLIADYRSASESINLHDVANIIVFYDSTHDYGVYKQARGRINRIGQTDDITYVHLTARETIEDEVYQALQRKESYDMIGYRGGK